MNEVGDSKMIKLNVYSSSDVKVTQQEQGIESSIKKKHLIYMLENDREYASSDAHYQSLLK